MSNRSYLATVFSLLVISGCSTDSSVTAAETTQSERPVVVATSEVLTDSASLKRGAVVFLMCRSCHTLEKEGVHLTGPNLYGLLGAAAGTKSGYAFSDALMSSGVTWDATSLDKWLANSSAFVPGNRMVFSGLPNAADRAALIAYLAEQTQPEKP